MATNAGHGVLVKQAKLLNKTNRNLCENGCNPWAGGIAQRQSSSTGKRKGGCWGGRRGREEGCEGKEVNRGRERKMIA